MCTSALPFTQATEPAVCVPISRGPRAVALFGDHKQLPPTVISREAELAGLGVSLFDRLVTTGDLILNLRPTSGMPGLLKTRSHTVCSPAGSVAPVLLDTQYRMHPAIAHFPSISFYGGALRSGTRASSRPPPRGFTWPHPTVGLAFVHVDGSERRDGTSHTNSIEAERVSAIVRTLISAGVAPADIGVLTPYASQVSCRIKGVHTAKG